MSDERGLRELAWYVHDLFFGGHLDGLSKDQAEQLEDRLDAVGCGWDNRDEPRGGRD